MTHTGQLDSTADQCILVYQYHLRGLQGFDRDFLGFSRGFYEGFMLGGSKTGALRLKDWELELLLSWICVAALFCLP